MALWLYAGEWFRCRNPFSIQVISNMEIAAWCRDGCTDVVIPFLFRSFPTKACKYRITVRWKSRNPFSIQVISNAEWKRQYETGGKPVVIPFLFRSFPTPMPTIGQRTSRPWVVIPFLFRSFPTDNSRSNRLSSYFVVIPFLFRSFPTILATRIGNTIQSRNPFSIQVISNDEPHRTRRDNCRCRNPFSIQVISNCGPSNLLLYMLFSKQNRRPSRPIQNKAVMHISPPF